MQDLAGHGGGVGHAGAAQSLHQGLLDDAVLDVQGQLAGALLGSAPADTVGEAADVLDLLGLDPLTLLGDGGGAVICALGNGAHVLYFGGINHEILLPFFLVFRRSAAGTDRNPHETAANGPLPPIS